MYSRLYTLAPFFPVLDAMPLAPQPAYARQGRLEHVHMRQL